MPLAARSRTALVLCACALLGAASSGIRPTSPTPASPARRDAVRLPAAPRLSARAIAPRRDPFAGGIDPEPPSPAPRAVAAVPPLPPPPRALPVPLPNAPLAAPRPQARVTAIVTGPHPSALVEATGGTILVTPGSRLGEDEVVEIGPDGVRLASGARLPLRTPEPLPATGSVR